MSSIGPGILSDLRTAVNATLLDSATNSRTGQTTACRVDSPTVKERLEGAPSMMRIWAWPILLPDATPVMPGDQLVIPTKGTYQAILVSAPTTLSASTDILACQTINATGTPVSPLLTNQTITLTNPTAIGGVQSITIGAYVYPAKDDLVKRPDADGYEWAAIWADATYPDGTRPRADHVITWSGLDTPPSQKVKISRPARYFSPVPYSCAYFLTPS